MIHFHPFVHIEFWTSLAYWICVPERT